MKGTTQRRVSALGFGVTAVGLLAVSAAYACTIYVGMMSVTAGGGTSTGTGAGTGDHKYCSADPTTGAGVLVSPGAVGTSGVPVLVRVRAALACNGSGMNQLDPSTTHVVTFNDGPAYTYNPPGPVTGYGTSNVSNLCTPLSTGKVTLQKPAALGGGNAEFTTDANGAGEIIAVLPSSLGSNAPTQDSAICVLPVGGISTGKGIMVPIHIL